MLPLRRTLTVLVLVSVILTTLTPAPLLGQPAAQTPLPPAEATLSASAAPEKPETPETPPQYLARLAPEADREALEAFLTELRAQEQIGAFQWLAEPQAFLITGEKGLALVIARPEVREILEATPEALALPPLAAESPAEEKARLERTAATEAAEAPPDAVTKIGDVFLLRLVAPETRETLDAAYARLGFDLNYLQQKGELGAYRWLPEANAVQVEILVPQAVDFLRRLADVADLVPWEDTALEQAQAEQEAVLQALTRAAPRAPAHIMAYTPTTPTVAAQLYNNYLSLTSDTDAAAVFTLTTATGAVKNDPTMSYLYWYSLTDGYGGYAYLYDADSNAISMLPGDILYVAQAGRAPFSMTLPRLTAYANAAANTVTGVAPSNISSTDPITPPALLVSMFTSQYVTTTATGDYLADNVGDFDPADSGLIRYYDTHGNQTYRNLRAPAVGLRGWNNWSNNDRVMGYVPTAAAFVAITLRRGGAAIATSGTTAGSDGYFSLYLSETIEGGDIVEVITDDWGATIAAPNFTVLSNPETDTLTGATDAVVVTTTYGAFQTLAAWPTSYYDSNPGQYVQPDGDGDFSAANPFYYNANSSGGDVTLDWSWGATGHLRYVDENGNRTYFRFKAPSPPPVLYARGYGSNDQYYNNTYLGGYITGFCGSEDGYGSATLRAADGTLKAQATNINACPSIYVNFGVAIEAGDVISAAFGGKTTTMTVPAFSATSDPDTDTVTGATNAAVVTTTYDLTRTLTLWPQTTSDNTSQPLRRIQPDVNGDFSATNPFETYNGMIWMTTTVDLRPGDVGHLRYIHADGNRTYFRFKAPSPPPVLYARGYGNSNQYSSNASLGGYITGFCSSEDGYGSATLRAADGTLKSQVTNIQACPSIQVNFSAVIEAGDVISATFGGKTTTMTVPEFTATVDPDTDTITGNTDADVVTTTYGLTRTLTLWPRTTSDNTSQALRRVQPAAGGDFSATNPFEMYNGTSWVATTVDLRPGDVGHLRYIHADGNRTYFRFKAPSPPPVLYARGYGNSDQYSSNTSLGGYITGFCSSDDGYGSATLRAADGTLKAAVTGNYACPGIYINFDVAIEAGDVISAAFGGKTTTMTVPAFAVISDPDTDTVTGVTHAAVVTTTYDLTRTLTVWPQTTSDSTYSARQGVQPDAGGNFTAANPFETYNGMNWVTTTVDIQPGNMGHLRYIHADGNRTYVGFIAPGLYVRGGTSDYVADNYVYIRANAGLPVTVTLTRGATTLGTVSQWLKNDNTVGIYLTDEDDNPILIQAGDIVEAALPGKTLTAQVPALTAAPDIATGMVSGDAPANITTTLSYAPHTLLVYRDRNDVGYQVTTPASGAYSADFSANGGLRLGDTGWLRYINNQGYHIYENYWLPIVYVRGYENGYQSENYVSGYAAEAGALITATLRRGTAVVATTYDWSNASTGQFGIYLRDVYNYAANILGGDILELQTDSGTTVVPIPQFTATSNHEIDTISGATDALVTSQTPYMTQTLAIWPAYTYNWDYGKHILPEGGAFTAANPFYYYADPANPATTLDWSYGATGHARYINSDGNQVYMQFQAPLKPFVYVRGYYSNQSYYAGNSVGGYVNGFCGYGTATLRDGAGAIKAQTNSAWACNSIYATFTDMGGNAEPILPGDRVEVTFGGVTTSVDVPDFAVTSDPDHDRLTGTTNAVVGAGAVTQTLALWPTSLDDYSYGKRVTVSGGAFTAENPYYYYADPSYSAMTLHWDMGARGHLRYTDAHSNRVYERFWAPYPQPILSLRGSFWQQRYVADNFVSGYAPGFCGDIEITVRNSSGVRLQLRHLRACSDFEVYLYGPNGAALNIQAGDTVDVVFLETSLLPISVTAPEFNVDSDHINRTVSGSTNATVVTAMYGMSQTLAVWPTSLYDSSYGKYVQPTGGVFSATNPFYYNADPTNSSTTLSWSAGTIGHLRYIHAQWHHIYARFYRPDLLVYLRGDHPSYSEKGYVAENLVSGYAPGLCDYGNVTLKDGAGTVKAQADVYACSSFYVYMNDNMGYAANIQAGDQVEAVFGGITKTLTVPAFTARSDTELERVTGATNAAVGKDTSLTVYPTSLYESSAPYQNVQPVAGVFTASNPFRDADGYSMYVDIKPGDQGHLRYTYAAGDRVHYYFMAPYTAPRIWVQKDGYRVHGYMVENNAPITVTLRRGGAVIATATGYTGNAGSFYSYFYDTANMPFYIRAGDTVRVQAGATTVDVPVVALTAQADVVQDSVWGTGPANARLLVNDDYPVRTAADGAYRADLRGRSDLRPGSSYQVSYLNAEGHTVYLVQYVAQVSAQLHTNLAWGYGLTAGDPYTATLRTGAVVKGVGYGATSSSYYFAAYLYDPAGNPVLIAAGDTLEVNFGGGQVVTLPIVALTTQINVATGAVNGTGPANALLGVDPDAYSNDHSVMTNNTGQWATQILDFYSWQDAHVRVRYANAQGHEVWLYTAVRPTIFVRGTGSGFNYTGEQTVAGYADGRAIVNISLRRGGNVIAQQRTLAAAYGWYNTNLTETIQAGDELSVQWTPRGTHTLVVPPLEANANASAGEIFGVGPANATIGVKAHNYTQNTTTSATGAFNVGMPLVTGNEAIYLCYQTPEGYWIHARSTSAPPPTIVASFTQSALAIVVGDTVYFTDTSTTDGNAIVSWDWRFGDGGISTAQHPSHQYNSVGVFTVWLTVADALGYSDSQSATVTVAAGCVPLSGIAFTYQPSEPHVNEPITFTTTYTPTTATAPITYAWVFGDGQTGTAPNPIHTYQSGGNWTARVTAYNPCTPAGVTYQQAVVIGVNKIFLPLTLRNQ